MCAAACSGSGKSDDLLIREAADNFAIAFTNGNADELKAATCAKLNQSTASRKVLPDQQMTVVDVSNIKIDGATATADVTTSKRTQSMSFTQENGKWLTCGFGPVRSSN